MAVRNVLPGQKRHLFPLSCYPTIKIHVRFTLKTALKLTSARVRNIRVLTLILAQ